MHLLELHFHKPDSFILALGQEYAIKAKGFFLHFYRGELIAGDAGRVFPQQFH